MPKLTPFIDLALAEIKAARQDTAGLFASPPLLEAHFSQDLGKELFDACSTGNADLARSLLARDANPHWQNENESTPLLACCLSGTHAMLEELITAGANPFHTNKPGVNCFEAIMIGMEQRDGRLENIEPNICLGAMADLCSARGHSSLIAASIAQALTFKAWLCVAALCAYTHPIDTHSAFSSLAGEHFDGSPGIIQALRRIIALPGIDCLLNDRHAGGAAQSILSHCDSLDKLTSLAALLEGMEFDRGHAFTQVCKRHHYGLSKKTLSLGWHLLAKGRPADAALINLARDGREFELALDALRGRHAGSLELVHSGDLFQAAARHGTESFQALLQAGICPPIDAASQLSSLMQAIDLDNHHLASLILATGVDFANSPHRHGLLQRATKHGAAKTLGLLADSCPLEDLETRDGAGRTLLLLAALHHRLDCAIYLHGRGADALAVDYMGLDVRRCAHDDLCMIELDMIDTKGSWKDDKNDPAFFDSILVDAELRRDIHACESSGPQRI